MPAVPLLEEGLREGLRGLGYVEGQNLLVEWRSYIGSDVALRSMAAELAQKRVNVIVAIGSPPTRVALEVTSSPVVFMAGDPVAAGFAESLAKPGRNATGLSVVYTELVAKQMDLLHQLAPKARRIGHLTNSSNAVAALGAEEARNAARVLGTRLIMFDARDPEQLTATLRRISPSMVDSVLVSGELMLLANKTQIAKALRETGLPTMFPFKDYHHEGVLMSYGPNLTETMHRLAVYVDKVLKGARPSAIPIEQVSRFEFVINLRLAHDLSIDVPQLLLLRADEVLQ